MTPHLDFEKKDVSDIVLMPGDPLRAKFIAKKFLKKVKKINNTRNMFGYTGYYKNKKISIIGSGMGVPSMGIYSYELFKFYDVKKIIRIGSCGSYTKKLDLLDLILVEESYSESTYAKVINNFDFKKVNSSKTLTNKIEEIARKNNININRGIVHTSDVFYKQYSNYKELVEKENCIAVEMECFALFTNAKILNKDAASILTVSDSLVTNEQTTSKQREKSFTDMIFLALESTLKL